MIEGTKPYRSRASTAKNPEASSANSAAAPAPSDSALTTLENAPQRPATPTEDPRGRRAWFRSLVPALGNGLVEILRTSNNLKSDLRELGSSDSKKA